MLRLGRRLARWIAGGTTSKTQPPATPPDTRSAIELWRDFRAAILNAIEAGTRRDFAADLILMMCQGYEANDVEAARGRIEQLRMLVTGVLRERIAVEKILVTAPGGLEGAAQRAIEEERALPRPPSAESIVARDLHRFGWWFPGDRIVIETRFGPRQALGLGRFRQDAPEWVDRRDTPDYIGGER